MKENSIKKLIENKGGSTNPIRLLDLLFDTPTLSIREVADKLKISPVAANKLVNRMVVLGILQELPEKSATRCLHLWILSGLLRKGHGCDQPSSRHHLHRRPLPEPRLQTHRTTPSAHQPLQQYCATPRAGGERFRFDYCFIIIHVSINLVIRLSRYYSPNRNFWMFIILIFIFETLCLSFSKKSSPNSSDFLKIVYQGYRTFRKKFVEVTGLSGKKEGPKHISPRLIVSGTLPDFSGKWPARLSIFSGKKPGPLHSRTPSARLAGDIPSRKKDYFPSFQNRKIARAGMKR